MKGKSLQIRIPQWAAFLLCLALMAVIPIARDKRLFGINLSSDKDAVETVSVNAQGETVINTTLLCKDVKGYAGPTPMEVYIHHGRISRIRFLDNNETPEFFGAVRNSDLTDRYIGLTPEEGMSLKVDAVSGATYSSRAVTGNIRAALAYALDENNHVLSGEEKDVELGWKFGVTLAIILAGAVIPLFLRHKGYRLAQLILNVVVLGFWGGTYICYSQMVGYLGYGVGNFWVALPLLLMLVTAFIYPMFGKVNHYCNWLCPYGSLQELAGKVVPWKIKMSRKTVECLTIFRDVLWFCLMWVLWTGLWFEWMDYEAFAVFFIRDAGAVVLGIAGGFILLSFVVSRPYCRFLCPTGTLFKLSEGTH